MKNKTHLFGWLLFTLTSVGFCALLSFRPIPGIDDVNDTGRYVEGFHEYCLNSIASDLMNENISYRFFHLIVSPGCLTGGYSAFLFEVAFFLPFTFLIFASWKKGSSLWATTLLLSVFGLELMTNAMRQSLGMLLFFGALASLQKHRVKALFMGLFAVIAHASVFAFIPFLLWLVWTSWSREVWLRGYSLLTVLIIGTVIVACSAVFYQFYFFNFFQTSDDLFNIYGEKYSEQLNVSFVIFMILPLYFVYGIRWWFEKESVTDLETKGILYSSALLIFCYSFFPFITYRYAIFSVAMQIFLVSISGEHRRDVGLIALFGLTGHLTFMFMTSSNFDVLIRG